MPLGAPPCRVANSHPGSPPSRWVSTELSTSSDLSHHHTMWWDLLCLGAAACRGDRSSGRGFGLGHVALVPQYRLPRTAMKQRLQIACSVAQPTADNLERSIAPPTGSGGLHRYLRSALQCSPIACVVCTERSMLALKPLALQSRYPLFVHHKKCKPSRRPYKRTILSTALIGCTFSLQPAQNANPSDKHCKSLQLTTGQTG